MSQDQGTPATLADAVEAARAEIVERGDPDPITGQTVEPPTSGQEAGTEVEDPSTEEVLEPASGDQASDSEQEQATDVVDSQDPESGEQSESEEPEELFTDLETEETTEETPPTDPEVPEAFEVPGEDEPVPTQELINGYLRQADYTRKTQEVARDRERLAKAEEFYTALTQHPKELAQQLAAAAGFIEPGAQPLKVVDLPFRSDDEMEAEIERRVKEAIGDLGDPEEAKAIVEEARNIQAMQAVEAEFAAIEEDLGKPIGPKSRKIVLEEAVKRGSNDIRLVFDALMQRQQEKARTAEQRKKSAPIKPTGKASTQTVTSDPETPLDAVALAAEQAGIDLDLDQLNFR